MKRFSEDSVGAIIIIIILFLTLCGCTPSLLQKIHDRNADCASAARDLHEVFNENGVGNRLVFGLFWGERHAWVVTKGKIYDPGMVIVSGGDGYVEKFSVKKIKNLNTISP